MLDQQQLQWRLHTLRVLFSSDDLPGLLVAIGGTRVLSALEDSWTDLMQLFHVTSLTRMSKH